MASSAEAPPPSAFADGVRVAGVLSLGAGVILVASSDLPTPVPWSYGLLPLALLWLARRVGLLFGALAAAATVGAVYAGGVQDAAPLFFVAVLGAAGLLLSACARRGVSASVALALSVTPVLAVAGGYLVSGGMQELTALVAARLEEIFRLEREHGVSRLFGISASEFRSAMEDAANVQRLLLPSLFALKWVIVMAVNCWLASVLFQAEDGFPAFEAFSTWRVHTAAAWVVAFALVLIVTRWRPALEAGVNLLFPLAVAYAIQGFAVARFAAIAFEMRGVVQAAIVVLVMLMPILLVAFVGIGFLDAWFDFRRRIVLGMDDSLGAGGGA